LLGFMAAVPHLETKCGAPNNCPTRVLAAIRVRPASLVFESASRPRRSVGHHSAAKIPH
jgi:hypothetical protein